MPNIFDGYARASDEQIKDQIALLETITLANTLKPYASKALRAGLRKINVLRNIFGAKEDIEEPKVMEVQECVEECRNSLDSFSRNDLDVRLRKALGSRLANTLSISEDALSVRVLNEAAKMFDIDDLLTPAQKADQIEKQFYEHILNNLQDQLKRQNNVDAEQTRQVLDEKIKGLSEDQRHKIQEILEVDSLTGGTMRDAIIKAGAPAAIVAAVSAGGFGSFIALSTIIHAVFTTVLGITLPFAAYTTASSALAFITGPVGWLAILGIGSWQLLSGSKKIERWMLAQTVWLSVGSYGRTFALADEELPGWVPEEQKEDVDRKDAEYAGLVDKMNLAVTLAETSNKQLVKLRSDIDIAKKTIHSNIEKQQAAVIAKKTLEDQQMQLEKDQSVKTHRISELEAELRGAAENAKVGVIDELAKAKREASKLDSEIQSVVCGIQHQQNLLITIPGVIAEEEKKLTLLEKKKTQLEIENEELITKSAEACQQTGLVEDSRIKEIISIWTTHFQRLTFSIEALRDAAKLNYPDKIKLEKVLSELHESNEPVALSRGKDIKSGCDFFGLKLSTGILPVRVEFRVSGGNFVEIVNLSGKYTPSLFSY